MENTLKQPKADAPALKTHLSADAVQNTEPGQPVLNREAQKMEELINQVNQVADAKTRNLVRECVNEILNFYGNGLEKIMGIVNKQQEGEKDKIIKGLLSDSFVSGLLLLHNLHPDSLETRLNKALDKVRPYIDGHGGSLQLTGIENGVASIRFSGTCQSCSFSTVTLELSIKKAIDEYCPDLAGLEVSGLEEIAKKNKEKASAKAAAAKAPVFDALYEANSLTNGEIKFTEANGTGLLLGKINDQLQVYYNQCPACSLPLSSTSFRNNTISCRLGHRFDLAAMGTGLEHAELRLKTYPVTVK